MGISKKPGFVLLRWIAVLPAVALIIALSYLFGQKLIDEETSKGNTILVLIVSFIWAAVTVYASIGISMSTAPFYKKATGAVVGVLVTLSLILLYVYIGMMYSFTPMVILKLVGFVVGLIVAYLALKKGEVDLDIANFPESSGESTGK